MKVERRNEIWLRCMGKVCMHTSQVAHQAEVCYYRTIQQTYLHNLATVNLHCTLGMIGRTYSILHLRRSSTRED